MINWTFDVNQYEEIAGFKPIPVGDHRVRIEDVEEKLSNGGNPMIKLTLSVSGHNGSLWHYIVFMADNAKLTNQKLGELFNSFGIHPSTLNNLVSWKGKVGACRVKHDTYNGETSAKVHYFISKDKQTNLPAWAEPSNRASVTGQAQDAGLTLDINVDDLPFM